MWDGFRGELEPDRMLNAALVEVGFVVVPKDAIQARILYAYLSRPFYISPSWILNWKTQSYAPDLPLAS